MVSGGSEFVIFAFLDLEMRLSGIRSSDLRRFQVRVGLEPRRVSGVWRTIGNYAILWVVWFESCFDCFGIGIADFGLKYV